MPAITNPATQSLGSERLPAPAPLASRSYRPRFAADYLGISRTKLYELVSEGALPPFHKIGRASLLLESDLAAFVARLQASRHAA